MAYTYQTASNELLKTGLTTGLEDQANTILAPLLQNNIIGIEIISADKARREGRYYDIEVGYETTGDVLLTSPYLLTTFQGRTLTECATLAAAFQALNPGYFYALPFIRFINKFASANKPYILWLFYCVDPNGVINWKVNNPSSIGLLNAVVGTVDTCSKKYLRARYGWHGPIQAPPPDPRVFDQDD